MSNDEKKFQPIFQILHIKNAWFLLELAMALVTTIGMRFLQVCLESNNYYVDSLDELNTLHMLIEPVYNQLSRRNVKNIIQHTDIKTVTISNLRLRWQ